MTGEIRGGNIREILARVLAHEATQTPLLIVLEDLHWFDSASWTLLVDVQQKVKPILLALNTRPLSEPVPLQFNQIMDAFEARLVKLDAMMLDDVESLVCQRLGVKSIPADDRQIDPRKIRGTSLLCRGTRLCFARSQVC